jgi:hypothetical protein
MYSNDDSANTSDLNERLRTFRAHVQSSIAAATQGLAEAVRVRNDSFDSFFRSCLDDLRRVEGKVGAVAPSSTAAEGAREQSGEQVSTATFASGDGATDEIIPEDARGKPGNWPAY